MLPLFLASYNEVIGEGVDLRLLGLPEQARYLDCNKVDTYIPECGVERLWS
jgi:hypothetical protein